MAGIQNLFFLDACLMGNYISSKICPTIKQLLVGHIYFNIYDGFPVCRQAGHHKKRETLFQICGADIEMRFFMAR